MSPEPESTSVTNGKGTRLGPLVFAGAIAAFGLWRLGLLEYLRAFLLIALAINVPAGLIALGSVAWSRRRGEVAAEFGPRFSIAAMAVIILLLVIRVGLLKRDSAADLRALAAPGHTAITTGPDKGR